MARDHFHDLIRLFDVFVYDAMVFKFLLLIMGVTCSRFKSTCSRYQDEVLSRVQPCLTSVRKRNRKGNHDDSESCEKEKNDFGSKEKNHIDVKPSVCVETEGPNIPAIKEVKVLPPIRTRTSISKVEYKPHSVWGGSVSSFYETIQRDSIVDDEITTGGRKRSRRTSSLRQHKTEQGSEDGHFLEREVQLKALTEAEEPSGPIEKAAFAKRRRNNTKLVSIMRQSIRSFNIPHSRTPDRRPCQEGGDKKF